MPVEMGVWRLDGGMPRRLSRGVLPSEEELEDIIEQDPEILGERLLVIGRQERTQFNKTIDLLAMDAEGNLRVLELKRDRTPREVVAQILDYGSWVSTLDRDSILEIANRNLNMPFEEAFAEIFDSPPPDELNSELRLTVVAADLDSSSERIVGYLRDFGVPINAVFFAYMEDDGRRYIARTWLSTDDQSTGGVVARKSGKKAEWNGRDWYVSFGESSGGRSWDDARRYGFVSAGHGEWYSKTIRKLPVGARIFVHIPKSGFVGVAETLGEAKPFEEAKVLVNDSWTPLNGCVLSGRYIIDEDKDREGEDTTEYVVPVRWHVNVPREEAFWTKGLYANQNSATKLRQQFTLDKLSEHFGLGTESAD